MNRAHLAAFLWLRWRVTVNQLQRSGPLATLLSATVTALMAAGAVVTLVAGFLIGLIPLRNVSPYTLMLVWDGASIAFVFLLFMGLISELQRADALSLDRVLHLPVSPSTAVLINFIGSSISLGLVVMLPAMTGLAAGLVVSRGPGLVLLFPLVAAFFLMMTALAYQFRGWLASLMQNPRRKRTVMAVVPILFVMTLQLPALWNSMGPGAQQRRDARAEARRVTNRLNRELAAGRITRDEYARRRPAPPSSGGPSEDTIRLANMALPAGWLAYGAQSAAQGHWWPALGAVLGMTLIATFSLRRAYATTLRVYRGDFDRARRQPAAAVRVPGVAPLQSGRSALATSPGNKSVPEWQLRWTSAPASAVAAATLKSWTRATEMKLALLSPIIMLVVFSRMLTGAAAAPELMRPLRTAGIAAFVLVLGMAGPMGNQFGYDRAGFRAFVLSPVLRRSILIGKNLAAVPFAMAMMVTVAAAAQWLGPMRVDHFVGVLVQFIPMYVVFCLAANLSSMLSPLTLKTGSGMPVPHQGLRQFGHVLFVVVTPLAVGLTLWPLGLEALFSYLNWFDGFPAYLVFGAVQAVVVLPLYRRVVEWEAGLLQRREQNVLAIVSVESR